VDLLLKVHRLDAGLEVLADLLLVARLGVDDVPPARPVVGALGSGAGPLGLLLEEFVLIEDGRGLVGRRLLGGRLDGVAGVLGVEGGGVGLGSGRLDGDGAAGVLGVEGGGVGLGGGRLGVARGQQVRGVLDGEFGIFVQAHQTSNSSRMDSENSQSRPATRAVIATMVRTTTTV
jgi:hypothetical protein